MGIVVYWSWLVRLREGMMIFFFVFVVCLSLCSNYFFMMVVKLCWGFDLEDIVMVGNDCLLSGRWYRCFDGIYICFFFLVIDGILVE